MKTMKYVKRVGEAGRGFNTKNTAGRDTKNTKGLENPFSWRFRVRGAARMQSLSPPFAFFASTPLRSLR